MMRCTNLEQLAAYQLDALDASHRARIATHLADCADCRRELAALAKTARLVETLPAPAVPDDLWPGVAARINVKTHPAPFAWWKALAGAGVVATLLYGMLAAFTASSRSLPIASPSTSPFVARHVLLAAQDPLTDRAALGVLLISHEGRP